MAGSPPYFVFGGPGMPIYFPVQAGQPVCITRAEFEGCCCGGPPPDLARFDTAVIRYGWSSENGTDLDTRTALLDVGELVNGLDVGWARGGVVSGPAGDYLVWGGDNTDEVGAEAVLVDFAKIAADYPALATIRIRMRAFWYNERADGDVLLQFETHLGGTMAPDGTDFVNVGGVAVDSLSRTRNVLTNISSNVDGEDLGTLVYTVATKTAVII